MEEITVKELRKKLDWLRDDDIIAPATGGDYEQWLEVYRMRDGSLEKLADLDEINAGHEDLSDDPELPLGIEVEFDLTYSGGNYGGIGEMAWVPCKLIDDCDGEVEVAFQKLTGISPLHIVHYSDAEVPENDHDQEDK